MTKQTSTSDNLENGNCFVIMPISDPDGYSTGHFQKVYEDIFKIAIEKAGFKPMRADDVRQTNFIHLDILQKLIDSPMALCDLSSRNPNVLFELGLRQAFDKPTVLVQEVDTPKIFDITPLRVTDYRRELKYREVLEDQISIAEAIIATKEATDKSDGMNSLIKLLSLTSPASLKDVTDKDSTKMFQILMNEISGIRTEMQNSLIKERIKRPVVFHYPEIANDINRLNHLIKSNSPEDVVISNYNSLRNSLENIIAMTDNIKDRQNYLNLRNDIENLMMEYRNIDNREKNDNIYEMIRKTSVKN